MSARGYDAKRVGAKASPVAAGGVGARLLSSGVVVGGIGVAVAMAPGGYNPFGPVKALVLLVAAALVAAGLAAAPGESRSAIRRLQRQPVAWAAAALVLVAMLATLTSVDPAQSLIGHYPEYQGLLLLVASGIVGFGASVLSGRDGAWRLIGRAGAVVVLVVSAYAFAQYAGFDPVPSLLEFNVRRVRSTLGNASNLGVFLVLVLPLVVARARSEVSGWRWTSWGAAAAGGFALVLSLSRGAWAGALVGAVAWLLVEGRGWKRATRLRAAGTAVAVMLAVFAFAALLVPNFGSRVAALADPSAGTPGWRIEVWSVSAQMVAARPFLGYGPGSYRYAFPAYRTAATMVGEGGAQVLEDPHNVFASAAVAGGVPGLLAFLTLAIGAVAAAWRLPEDPRWPLASPALTAGLVGGLTALQFHFFTLDTAPLFAMLVGLATGRAGASARGSALEETASVIPRDASVIRALAASVSALLALAAVLAAGLVGADYAIASGYGAVEARAPWTSVRAGFERARALAPWEPSVEWALGRAATGWMSATRDPSPLPDAAAAMSSVVRRLPADPLAAAQAGEAYLVAGLAAKDAGLLRQALGFAERAIAMDPQNGYRWEAKGTAQAALGDSPGAVAAYLRAVQYAPGDMQAWANLASVYERSGDAAKAADAQRHADALARSGGSTGR